MLSRITPSVVVSLAVKVVRAGPDFSLLLPGFLESACPCAYVLRFLFPSVDEEEILQRVPGDRSHTQATNLSDGVRSTGCVCINLERNALCFVLRQGLLW